MSSARSGSAVQLSCATGPSRKAGRTPRTASPANHLSLLLLAGCMTLLAGCADAEPVTGAPTTTMEWDDQTSTGGHDQTPSPGIDPHQEGPQTRSDAGARSFVTSWFSALNDAYRSGDGERVQQLSESDCTACADFVTAWATTSASGQRAGTDIFTVQPGAVSLETDDIRYVSFRYSINAVTLRSAASAGDSDPGRIAAEAPRDLRAVVVWDGARWSMGEMGP